MAGSQTTKTEIPEWLEAPTRSAIERGEAIGKIGYTPYYGPDVAAFAPQQNAAFENTNAAANAFGMSVGQNAMPAPQQFSNGMQGYSSAPLFEEAKYRLYENNPNQYGYMNSFFVNPQQGEYAPVGGAAPAPMPGPGSDIAATSGGTGKGGASQQGVEQSPSGEGDNWAWGAQSPAAIEARAANRAAGNIQPDFGNIGNDLKTAGQTIASDVRGLFGR